MAADVIPILAVRRARSLLTRAFERLYAVTALEMLF